MAWIATQSAFADESTSAASPDAPKYALAYQFKPGETIRTKVLQQVRLDTTIAGSTQVAETVSGSVKVWKIVGVDPQGEITFEHSVESVNMLQKVTGRQEVTYNSQTDKHAPPQFQQVAKLVGVPLADVTIDRSGRITKRIEKRANAQIDAQSQMLTPLPADPIAVGEEWNEPVDIVVSLEAGEKKLIKTRQHYALEKVASGVATISVATQILTPVHDPKVQSQLVQRLTKGTIRFDIDAGRVLSQQIDLDERVLGFQGNDSSLHYLGRFTEQYQPDVPETAAVPLKTATTKALEAQPSTSTATRALKR
ncbi:MAG: hypothetical protein IT427_01200 [Pirellulales bacterium]|nr:hypothetical protein [Pirellulales bacterium]